MKQDFNFIIDKNNGNDLDELIELTKTYYEDSDIVKKNYLEWQYNDNPSGKPFLFTSREEKTNELAGQYLVIPIKFKVMDKEILGTLSLNTLTRPSYQGKGLFTKMAKATYEDCKINNAHFTIGFPNPNSYPGFVKNLDFKHLGDIPLLIKPLRLDKVVLSYFKKDKIKHGGSIELFTLPNDQIKEFDFEDKNDISLYRNFWDAVKKQYKISTYKDFEFIKWRYNDIPTRNYKLYYYKENNIIKGFIVVKAEHVWGFNAGIIMDFMVMDNDSKIAKKMLKYINKLFKKSRLFFVAALHNESYEFSVLKNNGFYKLPQKILPQKIHFIYRINKDFEESNELSDLKNWKLTFADYDVF